MTGIRGLFGKSGSLRGLGLGLGLGQRGVAGGDAPAFTPTDDPGALHWYDASQELTVGTLLTLTDRIGSLDMTSAGDPVSGSSTKNGLNVIDLDDVDDGYISVSNIGVPVDGNFAIHFAGQVTGVDKIFDAVVSIGTAGGEPNSFQISSASETFFNGRIDHKADVDLAEALFSPPVGGNPMIMSLVFDLTNTRIRAYVGGAQVAEILGNYDSAIADSVLGIFVNRANNNFIAGQFYECVFTSSIDNYMTYQTYMGDKWNVS